MSVQLAHYTYTMFNSKKNMECQSKCGRDHDECSQKNILLAVLFHNDYFFTCIAIHVYCNQDCNTDQSKE